MSLTADYLQFPGSATVGEVLRAYVDRECEWWWLLIAETEGGYKVCSFGSLLPYLTGRTPHSVHSIGECPVCTGLDPLLWRATGTLVEEALGNTAACSRLVSDLPMAQLPAIDDNSADEARIGFWLMGQRLRACAVTEKGVVCGVYVMQYMGVPGALPEF